MTIYNNQGWPGSFEAVHLSLIPKGPYQGMVLVWDIIPVVAKDPPGMPALGPNQWRSFQAYAIIDLADTPLIATPNDPAVRYRNFLLPMDPPVILPGSTTDLFCSGHTWSPFGDLIVVGGTTFTPGFLGARFTYAWNPDRLIGAYPGSLTYFPYPGFGLWEPGPLLQKDRWYPTATLTHPLQRTFGGTPPRQREVVLVMGGSEIDPGLAGTGFQSTWNSFESLIVDARATPGNSGLVADFLPSSPADVYVWPGPGTALGAQEWFEEYPRVHLLSTGRVFFSSYAPRWARMDPENLGVWQSQPFGPFSSNWDRPRHDGASLLFPNLGNQYDRVLRLGGADTHFYFASAFGTTETVESLAAGSPNPTWQSEPSLPVSPVGSATPPGRQFLNAVTLPNGEIFVVGGLHRAPGSSPSSGYTLDRSASLFSGGVMRPLAPPSSVRAYHSTAILLADGRILVGGGYGRTSDYEIFSPAYVTDPVLSTQRPTNVVFPTLPPFNPLFDAYELAYNGVFTVACDPLPTGVVLDRAVLMAPGSTTHHSDMCQRYVQLQLLNEEATPNQLTLQAPPSSKHAPRGIYMLFLVTNTGAVSRKAVWVFLP